MGIGKVKFKKPDKGDVIYFDNKDNKTQKVEEISFGGRMVKFEGDETLYQLPEGFKTHCCSCNTCSIMENKVSGKKEIELLAYCMQCMSKMIGNTRIGTGKFSTLEHISQYNKEWVEKFLSEDKELKIKSRNIMLSCLANMVGKKLYEEFLCNGKPYRISENGIEGKIIETTITGHPIRWVPAPLSINALLGGKIESIPHPPVEGERFYYVEVSGDINKRAFGKGSLQSLLLYKSGNYFLTREEAEKNKDRILKDLKIKVLNKEEK